MMNFIISRNFRAMIESLNVKKPIFEYLDYKRYLEEITRSMPGSGRGFRQELARAIGCQNSFISQVMSKDLHFSLEQAERINRLLRHAKDESHFFLLLVQFNRAGTPELREYFRSLIKAALSERLHYEKRTRSDHVITTEERARYYSSWHFEAVFVILGIPGQRTPQAISRRLNIPLKRVNDALQFLLRCDLVERKGEEFLRRGNVIHLGDSAQELLANNHTQWRVRAIAALQSETKGDIHYSGIMTMSKDDLHRLRSLVVSYIEEIQKTVIPSSDETIAALGIDFYEL